MKAPLWHINCRNLTLESADELTNMSSLIQDTTYFAVFLQTIQGSNPAICLCYFNTEDVAALIGETSTTTSCRRPGGKQEEIFRRLFEISAGSVAVFQGIGFGGPGRL